MSYVTLTADSGLTVTGYTARGNFPSLQVQVGSRQRLGSDQPIWWQSGLRSSQDDVMLQKKFTSDLATAKIDRDILRAMQGQRITGTDQFGDPIEIIAVRIEAEVREGANQWLVEATISCEAMPITTPTFPSP